MQEHNINYIPINSVLFNISSILPENQFEEYTMLNWLIEGYKQIDFIGVYEVCTTYLDLTNHKIKLPSDVKHIEMIAYSPENMCTTETSKFTPYKIATGAFNKSLCVDPVRMECSHCKHEISFSPSGYATSTIGGGTVLLTYRRLPKDSEGNVLIPNNEILKEALFHYGMLKFWLSRFTVKEDGAESRMAFHKSQWQVYSTRAVGELNMPSTMTLENIKSLTNRLLVKMDEYENQFTSLNKDESIRY
jgi:hypothetical protein